jgi:hypothetical protein
VSERNTYKHNKHNRISGAIIAMIPQDLFTLFLDTCCQSSLMVMMFHADTGLAGWPALEIGKKRKVQSESRDKIFA